MITDLHYLMHKMWPNK